ncbi:MDN1-containing protein [Melampsora larici-populina 98AG31]|uniref:MDN1-containing protein n=1 Tax=Melampsora larici-populina (strain 98AG31 / pathotype 3-4-7) TaxID=747676 RepID=F4R314_MELLP|nr:MDN1-containing protein [Melampsora larici-populina 98AG31]EGG12550.1 MDN1-containing protein [Melampsora larici-populina 98AG31]
MSSDSDLHTIRGETVAPHSPLLHSNSSSHQQVMDDLLPDSPQNNQLQEPGLDSHDQFVEQTVFLPGSHALNECDCFDPVSPMEYESENDSPAQPVHQETMPLFRDEASPSPDLLKQLNRFRSIETESSLEYLPAIKSESDHQDQSIESRPPTPGPGWSDGILNDQIPDISPNGEPMEEEIPSSQQHYRFSSGEEKPDIDTDGDQMEEEFPSPQEQPRLSSGEEKPDIDTDDDQMEEECPSPQEQFRFSSGEEKPDIDPEGQQMEEDFPSSQEQPRLSSGEEKPDIDTDIEQMEEELPSSQEQPRLSSGEEKPDINPEGEQLEEDFPSSQEQPRLSSGEEKPDIDPEDEQMEEELPSSQEQPRFSSGEEKPDINPEDGITEDEIPALQGQSRIPSHEEDEQIGIQLFDSRGSPLTSNSSNGEELSSTQNRSDLHHYARLVEQQATPGPSNQPNPNSGNTHALSPETLRLWRLGFVDARGRRSPQSMRQSSPCLGPSSRDVSVHNDARESNILPNLSRRDEVNAPTQDLQTTTALKPQGKKIKNQANDSTLPAKKKSKTKQVKKSQPAKQREEPQAQLTNSSHTISPPAIPPTPPPPQEQPTTSSQTRSTPAIPPTPPNPQDKPESSPPRIQAQTEIPTQRPGRALRPRRLDGRAATNLRSRALEEGIDSNQNKKKRGETQTGAETSSSRNLNAPEDQEVVENTQSEAVPPRPFRRLILRLRPPVDPVDDQAQEEVVADPQPEVQVTEPRRPRRLILRLRSPSNPDNRN